MTLGPSQHAAATRASEEEEANRRKSSEKVKQLLAPNMAELCGHEYYERKRALIEP